MEITVREIDGKTCVIGVSGRLSAVSAGEVKDTIKNQVEAGHNGLLIDLSGTDFIDSSGLSALVSGLKLTRERKSLHSW